MKWLLLLCFLLPCAAAADDALWKLLGKGGQVLFIRHAETTPGVGDPQGFKLDDCTTQRNLSPAGREQAQRMGAEFKRRGIPVGEVLASPWCRCADTAALAFGSSKPWAPLSNLFGRQSEAERQVRAMRSRISTYRGKANLVLVSHGSTAAALAGQHPTMGEALVLTPTVAGFDLAGRLLVP